MPGRPGEYLFKRKGSQNWYLRLQYNIGSLRKVDEISMGTPDRDLAELRAADKIGMHRQRILLGKMLRKKNISDFRYKREFEKGIHHLDNGGTVIAGDEYLIYTDANGNIIKETESQIDIDFDEKFFEHKDGNRIRASQQFLDEINGRTIKTEIEFEIIDRWVRVNRVNAQNEAEARKSLGIAVEISKKKSKNLNRKDAIKLVEYLETLGLKSQTIAKKIAFLSAAYNIAVLDQTIQVNPFSRVFKSGDDKLTRLPFSDDDIKLIDSRLFEWDPKTTFLWRFLLLTGCRLSEPFEVDEDFKEGEIRFVILGTKTPASKRRLPIPEPLLSLVPELISKATPLMTGKPEIEGKKLNRLIRKIGITDERKVLHSLRHRAKDRLRAAGCPLDVQYHILGHEQKTVASSYGAGYPVKAIQYWMKFLG